MDDPAAPAPRPRPFIIAFLRSLPPWLLRALIPLLIACIRLYIVFLRARLVLAQIHVLFLRLVLSVHPALRSAMVALEAFMRAERGAIGVLVWEVVGYAFTVWATFRVAQVGLWAVRWGMLYFAGVWDVEGVEGNVRW